MSGGIDSAVAALLLQRRGWPVQGLTVRLWHHDGARAPDRVVSSARSVCENLGIAHRVVDLGQLFYQDVVAYFVREYARGRTPNPCQRCNRLIKFGTLLARAQDMGCAFLATGHYACIRQCDGEYSLHRGADHSKDQSYFLYALNQDRLARTLFPLGEMTKRDVRSLAREAGLPVADRAESQDVCFAGPGGYRQFLADRFPDNARPGPIYDLEGHLLGAHRGLSHYTVGQRGGLGIAAPEPLYVKRLDAHRNALIVTPARGLGADVLEAEDVTFVSGQPPREGTVVEAMIRYRARPRRARLWPLHGGGARLEFEESLRDITPGQTVVFYSGDMVLGGGTIVRSL